MSETAQTLIKAALRALGVIAAGETPKAEEMADGLEALKIMLRSWSVNNLMIYFIEQDTLAMSGAVSYTIGSGGDCNTVWPSEIKGAVVDDIYELTMISETRYRRLSLMDSGAAPTYLYHNPEYPLGLLYPYPTGGSSMVIDSLKALTEPAALTTEIAFPPPYDAAIKWNLAIDMAPEFGKEPSLTVINRAIESKRIIESRNLASQLNTAMLDIRALGKGGSRYDINQG